MAVPDFQSLTLPLLRLASAGDVHARQSIEKLAEEFHLTADERTELLPSGRQTRLANRVHWAIIYLQRAGLISRRSRGLYQISTLGRTVLENAPERLDLRFLSQFPGVREFRQKRTEGVPAAADEPEETISQTPDERIEIAVNELNESLRTSLLERILSMTPARFEKLIVDLMLGMGYGAGGSGRHLGRTADGGVDGVINEDVLGLDVIYLQAKRYAPGNTIGVEKIREFAGALDEKGATKGVFVTTSSFAGPARQYAERSPKRLVLIDGSQLADHLVSYGVAVRTYQTVELKKIDLDYFEEPEI